MRHSVLSRFERIKRLTESQEFMLVAGKLHGLATIALFSEAFLPKASQFLSETRVDACNVNHFIKTQRPCRKVTQ